MAQQLKVNLSLIVSKTQAFEITEQFVRRLLQCKFANHAIPLSGPLSQALLRCEQNGQQDD